MLAESPLRGKGKPFTIEQDIKGIEGRTQQRRWFAPPDTKNCCHMSGVQPEIQTPTDKSKHSTVYGLLEVSNPGPIASYSLAIVSWVICGGCGYYLLHPASTINKVILVSSSPLGFSSLSNVDNYYLLEQGHGLFKLGGYIKITSLGSALFCPLGQAKGKRSDQKWYHMMHKERQLQGGSLCYQYVFGNFQLEGTLEPNVDK